MDSIEQLINNASSRQRELLHILMETDYAKPSLEQQTRYITDLENQIQQMTTRITTLEDKRQKELKDHEKYQNSVMKRFAYKVGGKSGKFDAEAEKEEREYFEALHDEHIAKQMCESTSKALEAAKEHRTSLDIVAAKHTQAQKDLDALYDSIFQGPSPGFTEEDKAEEDANDALRTFNELRMHVEANTQVVQILKAAQIKMNQAAKSLAGAHKASQFDIFTRGVVADMVERNKLSQAEADLSETYQLVMQAQRISPEVQPLPMVQVANGHFMSDMLFDNPFSDMAFHDRIKQSEAEQRHASMALDYQVQQAIQRLSLLNDHISQMSGNLEQARLTLQKVREKAFHRVARRNKS